MSFKVTAENLAATIESTHRFAFSDFAEGVEVAEIAARVRAPWYRMEASPAHMLALCNAYKSAREEAAQTLATIGPRLAFERVIRDCPHNERVDAGQAPARSRIYDFEVYLCGDASAPGTRQRVAIFSRTYTGKGYSLHDRAGEPIPGNTKESRRAIKCDSKARFAATLAAFWGRVPDAHAIAAREAERRLAAARAREDAAARAELEAIATHARALYDAAGRVADVWAAQCWAGQQLDGSGDIAAPLIDLAPALQAMRGAVETARQTVKQWRESAAKD